MDIESHTAADAEHVEVICVREPEIVKECADFAMVLGESTG